MGGAENFRVVKGWLAAAAAAETNILVTDLHAPAFGVKQNEASHKKGWSDTEGE